MGDSFASGEGNPDVPVRFSPERTTDYGIAPNDAPLTGYPARIGDWQDIGDKKFIEENARWQDQACHRSLYSHQLRAALQLAVEDPHRAVTFVGVRLLGRGDDVRPLPRIQGQRVGAQSAGPAADFRRRRGAMRRQGCARLRLAGGLSPQRPDPRAQGRPGAQEVRREPCAQDRSAVAVGRRQRRGLCPAGRQRRAGRHSRSCASLGGWFGQVHGLFEASPPARRAGRPNEIAQSRPARLPARALAGIRPRSS